MHIKAIPADISKFASAHPLMIGAAVVAVVAGGLYLRGGGTAADVMPGGASSADAGFSSFSYTVPSILPNSGGGGGGSGIADSVTAPQGAGGLSSNDNALLSFEYYKENHNFALATTDLANQIAIAGLNADVARASVDASLYSANIGLAQSFMMSGQQFSTGRIGNFNFAFLGQAPARGTNKGARRMASINNMQFNSLLRSPTIQSLLGLDSSSTMLPSTSGTGSYAVQPATRNDAVVAYGGATVIPAATTGTSTGTTSIASGTGTGTAIVPIDSNYVTSPTLSSKLTGGL